MRPTAVSVLDVCRTIAPDGWLGHRTQDRFLHLGASGLELGAGEVERFFARRGLPCSDCDERTLAQELVAVDLRAVAHAASFLLSGPAEETARGLLRDAVGATPADDVPRLDHVGLEVFGRLEWYIAALESWSRQGAVPLRGCRLFPSVQVRRALAVDPQLADVRIARAYLETEGRQVNLEIFEATQHWRFTAARQLATFSDAPEERVAAHAGELGEAVRLPLVPVAHVALAVSRQRTLNAVERILGDPQRSDAAVRAYAEGPCYNPADDSLNTKFRARSQAAGGAVRLGPIIELIHYGGRAPSLRPRGASSLGAVPGAV